MFTSIAFLSMFNPQCSIGPNLGDRPFGRHVNRWSMAEYAVSPYITCVSSYLINSIKHLEFRVWPPSPASSWRAAGTVLDTVALRCRLAAAPVQTCLMLPKPAIPPIADDIARVHDSREGARLPAHAGATFPSAGSAGDTCRAANAGQM